MVSLIVTGLIDDIEAMDGKPLPWHLREDPGRPAFANQMFDAAGERRTRTAVPGSEA